MSGDAKWLTRAMAAAYVGCPSVDSFDWWRKSRGVRAAGRRGRVPLFLKDDLDRVLKSDATHTSQRRGLASVRSLKAVG